MHGKAGSMRATSVMLAAVVLGGCKTFGVNDRAMLEHRVWLWTEAFYESETPSGRDICGRELHERRQHDFYRAYGKSFRAVLNKRIERYGREQTISVQPCMVMGEAESRRYRESLVRFEDWLAK